MKASKVKLPPIPALLVIGAGFYLLSHPHRNYPLDAEPPATLTQQARWAWTKEPWTGDNTPYEQAAQDMVRQGKMSKANLEVFRRAALRNPNDPVARFVWGYYAYNFAIVQSRLNDRSDVITEPCLWFEKYALSPAHKSYLYAMTHFLLLGQAREEGSQEMAEMGERLLHHTAAEGYVTPVEPYVKFYTTIVLAHGTEAHQAKAIRYAQELQHQFPRMADSYALIGWIYQNRWLRHKRSDDRRLAIANFRGALNLGYLTADRHEKTMKALKNLEG